MAEVLVEAQLCALGVKQELVAEFLLLRDQLLRTLANESGRESALSVALALREARNSPDGLEDKLCAALRSLGFEVTPIGGSGKPDGVATALLSADEKGSLQQYAVSLEAKSKQKDKGKVAAGTVKVSAIIRQRDQYKCNHALVVGRAFPTSKGDTSALATEIDDDRSKTAQLGDAKTITLITIDDLAALVRLRPVKHLGLRQLRDLFQTCRLPEESAKWVEAVKKTSVKKPPYRKIVETIQHLHKTFKKSAVKYAALRVELSHLMPPVAFEVDDELADLCKAMAQMAPGALYATSDYVELDQSAQNVIAAIDAATKEYQGDEQ